MSSLRDQLNPRTRYAANVVQGHARAHLGNTYIEHQHVTNVASELGQIAGSDRPSDFVEALEFDYMESRLDSIDPADADSCTWLFRKPEYIRWRSSAYRETNGGLLWIKGKAGCGKSTMMKCALEYGKKQHTSDTIVSFFFNARGHMLEQSVEGMYRSILSQMIKAFPVLRSKLPPRPPPRVRDEGWPVPLLRNTFARAIHCLQALDEPVTLYIDALDECEEDEIREAVEHFESLTQRFQSRSSRISICFASRYYPQVSVQRCEEFRLDQQSEHRIDVWNYVQHRLRVRNESLKRELGNEICSRCSQVFLWVVLVVRRLNARTDRGASRAQMMTVLDGIPEKLEDLIADILKVPDEELICTMELVLLSEYPLEVETLYFATICATNQLNTDTFDHNDIDGTSMRLLILSASRGLVELTTNKRDVDNHAQFVHESVRNHLLVGGLAELRHCQGRNAVSSSHARLAKSFLAFIKSDGERQGSTPLRSSEHFRAKYLVFAMAALFYHMEMAFVGGEWSVENLGLFPTRTWITMRNAMDRLMHEHRDPLKYTPTTLLYILILYGCRSLARKALVMTIHRTPSSALKRGLLTANFTSKTRLANTKSTLNAYCGGEFGYLIAVASKCGYHEIVELLLHYGADPNPSGFGALDAAALGNHIAVARSLLRHGADPRGRGDSTLLCIMAKNDNADMVELLLEFGADPNVHDRYQSILSIAFAMGGSAKVKIIGLLLRAGARTEDLDMPSTPFDEAESEDSEELFHLLLDHQRDKTEVPFPGLLLLAVKYLHNEGFSMLLAKGADANARTRSNENPLHVLAHAERPRRGARDIRRSLYGDGDRLAIATTLLKAGADVDAIDRERRAPLYTASREGHTGLVQLLLDHGADVHHGTPIYGTALDIASSHRHVNVVTLLREKILAEQQRSAASSTSAN